MKYLLEKFMEAPFDYALGTVFIIALVLFLGWEIASCTQVGCHAPEYVKEHGSNPTWCHTP